MPFTRTLGKFAAKPRILSTNGAIEWQSHEAEMGWSLRVGSKHPHLYSPWSELGKNSKMADEASLSCMVNVSVNNGLTYGWRNMAKKML